MMSEIFADKNNRLWFPWKYFNVSDRNSTFM